MTIPSALEEQESCIRGRSVQCSLVGLSFIFSRLTIAVEGGFSARVASIARQQFKKRYHCIMPLCPLQQVSARLVTKGRTFLVFERVVLLCRRLSVQNLHTGSCAAEDLQGGLGSVGQSYSDGVVLEVLEPQLLGSKGARVGSLLCPPKARCTRTRRSITRQGAALGDQGLEDTLTFTCFPPHPLAGSG